MSPAVRNNIILAKCHSQRYNTDKIKWLRHQQFRHCNC